MFPEIVLVLTVKMPVLAIPPPSPWTELPAIMQLFRIRVPVLAIPPPGPGGTQELCAPEIVSPDIVTVIPAGEMRKMRKIPPPPQKLILGRTVSLSAPVGPLIVMLLLISNSLETCISRGE